MKKQRRNWCLFNSPFNGIFSSSSTQGPVVFLIEKVGTYVILRRNDEIPRCLWNGNPIKSLLLSLPLVIVFRPFPSPQDIVHFLSAFYLLALAQSVAGSISYTSAEVGR